jgi:putative hydrolase of HD superfamily
MNYVKFGGRAASLSHHYIIFVDQTQLRPLHDKSNLTMGTYHICNEPGLSTYISWNCVKPPDDAVVAAPTVPEPWTLDKALAVSSVGKPVEGSSSPVPFFHVIERLKTTSRAGWLRFGVHG